MDRVVALVSLALLPVVHSQQAGTVITETQPRLSIQQCTGAGCTTLSRNVTLDSNWRWLHSTSSYTNCYTGNTWDASLCPDGMTCAQHCALDGADYSNDYGITTSGNSITLKLKHGGQTQSGSRVFLMQNQTHYQTFNLKNQEFVFDVDMSTLPCGVNGALYLAEMAADGGIGKFSNNRAGAKYGTGYCDAQCPHDVKFINGEANILGWRSSENDLNVGFGSYGACCSEMDIWNANSISAAVIPHTCSISGQVRCQGTDCDDSDERQRGLCDKDGCDFNSFRLGNRDFIGPGKSIDTTKKFTIVTQFLTIDNSTNGDLVEIRRIYVQGGKVIQNSKVNISGMQPFDSITDEFCSAQKTAFGDYDRFGELGGLKSIGDSFARGMVLIMSLRDDRETNMLWLDGAYPTDADPSEPGIARGPCPSGTATLPVEGPEARVTFSNIRFGPIGSTSGVWPATFAPIVQQKVTPTVLN